MNGECYDYKSIPSAKSGSTSAIHSIAIAPAPAMNSISIEAPGPGPAPPGGLIQQYQQFQHSPLSSSSSGSGGGSGAPSPNSHTHPIAASTTSLPVTVRGKNGSWCSCPGSVSTSSENHGVCPVCLAKYDADTRIPMGLTCAHLVCLKCVRRLYPVGGDSAVPNIALLAYLDYPPPPLPRIMDPECLASIFALRDIALLLKSHVSLSRAIHRKVLHLITSLSLAPNSQTRICRAARGVGERVLVELVSSCSHLSHYQAQQQLWAAIRARACQFMGPAMQEEALKLVLLALEDGSALSRKVLVMFVVQRLSPQFPQASKTSIGHVIQLLYRASCFDVQKRADSSSLMTLRPEYRAYEALRKEHDAQIVKIALESGIRFSPEQWSSILYGDNSHKPHMQSIIDKLLAPQSFTQMVTEFLVNIQRLTDPEDAAFLFSIHPHFQTLSNIDLQPESPGPPWRFVHDTLDSVSAVLIGLVTFNPKAPSKTTVGVALSVGPGGVAPPPQTHYQLQQSRSLSLGPPDPHAHSHSHPHARQQSAMQHQLQRGHRPLLRVGNILQPAPPQPHSHVSPSWRSQQQPLGRQHSAPVTVGAFTSTPSYAPPAPAPEANANPAQINELLAESRLLRAKMKLLQDQLPPDTSTTTMGAGFQRQQLELELQAEAAGLEEAACSMVQKLNV